MMGVMVTVLVAGLPLPLAIPVLFAVAGLLPLGVPVVFAVLGGAEPVI